MFSLFNPWVILGALLALAGAFGYGHHAGYQQKETEDAVVIGHKNQEMQDAKEQADAELKKTQDKLTVAQKQFRDSVRSGDQRMFVRVAAPVGCAASANADSAPTAQLDPAFADSLVSITDDGDSAIVQLNACIDRYEAMRKIVNGKR